MDGVIVVNKEKNYTSRDIVNIVSKALGIKKVGHTGTLDPLATGVLVLVVGKATKLVNYLTSMEKEYVADIILGIDTDTLDITGNILKEEKIIIEDDKIVEVLDKLKGTYLQEVPKYSAVKVKGRKLYEYARNNEEVILPKKEVTIYRLDLVKSWIEKDHSCFQINTLVSKGTYIRSLIRDIASELSTIGTMTALKRTKQGRFTLEDTNTIEEIKEGKYKLLTLSEILSDIPQKEIPNEWKSKIQNGNIIPDQYHYEKIAFTQDGQIIALYKQYEEIGYLKPEIMF